MRMLTARHRIPLLVPLLLLGFLGSPRVQANDDWTDARKDFRRMMKAEDWKERRDAFLDLLEFDGAETVEEVLRALERETNPAVVKAGLDTLVTLLSPEADAALLDALKRGRGEARLYALIVLADKPTVSGVEILMEELAGKDEPVICQAALALGRKQVEAALPQLLGLLEHKAWQVRSAAARALETMAGAPTIDPQSGETVLPPLPTWMEPKEVLGALASSLERGEGRERSDMISALGRIGQQDYGWDPEAWKRLAAGQDPTTIRARPEHPPYILGVPIYGRRVILLVDISTCTDDLHPYQDLGRLKELCAVPGARAVPWFKLRTTKQFFAGHAVRLIRDLPKRGTKFEVIAIFNKYEGLFGKLTPANSGTKAKAIEFIEEFNVQNGPNHYPALMQALDISGAKDSVAWSLGPDEIVFLTCAIPWAPSDPNAMTDQDVVGAAVALKARLRMVPVHTIGVGPHPFEMMREIAKQTGGRYLDLSR